MCVVSQQLCIIAGNDFFFDLQYLAADGVTPIPLAGCVATMQLLEAVDSVTATLDMSGGIIDATTGMMRFTLTDIETQGLLPIAAGNLTKSFVSDVQLTYVDLTKEVILRTSTTIEQGRTRP